MPEDDARRPRIGRPKLRTSCDECGAAKLRCDRGQPECGRCVSHGISCVYGVSRKMGKPPRQKPRSSSVQVSTDQVNVTEACDTADDMIDLEGSFDQSTLPLSAFTSLDFNEWPNVDQFNTSLFPNTPESYATHFTIHPVQPSKSHPAVDQILPHHDCSRKAYDMLGRLSLFDDRSLGTPLAADEVPFDHVLRLSREASEQLSKLLACSCAPCPSLTFVKASIISKILSWYHQAAICMQVAASRALTAIPNSVTPACIAVGSFNVDDERVQAALKIQLLLGEMRRAGLLIDQFTMHGTGSTYHDDQSNPDSVDRLYKHLTTWLKGEHSRIIHIMRSKLRELNS
ncbi:uncharacterized protein BDR25DRAFT_339825 [Lindgomyces ingoldianus]|uniref:Uncharacterized protein n=1 Tax=Lindgomyces ingoldianus TaxID=673940 RepID=A0ACB6RC00_9PLEO|nr:uncharacterized protein BDR25DRAFT_339825 [Lindgomyces ingoldianus]KAF2475852.1 hypothetical protein BDR25DRAFT_339825 [Lindgomyces ingoldianus]